MMMNFKLMINVKMDLKGSGDAHVIQMIQMRGFLACESHYSVCACSGPEDLKIPVSPNTVQYLPTAMKLRKI
jgi:hypothetical protein